MNYNELIESIDGCDLHAAPAAVRLRFLRLTLRATMTFAAAERDDLRKKCAAVAWVCRAVERGEI